MPINPNMPKSRIINELLRSYKDSGKIGNTRPKDMRHAIKIANAIANRVKRGSKR